MHITFTDETITPIDTIQYFLNTLYKKNLKKKKQFLDNSSNPLLHPRYVHTQKKNRLMEEKKKREIKKNKWLSFTAASLFNRNETG